MKRTLIALAVAHACRVIGQNRRMELYNQARAQA